MADLDLGRPIRVVLFCGPALDPGAVAFILRLEAHPEIEYLGGFCQAPGLVWTQQLRDLWRRRGMMAVPVLTVSAAAAAVRFVTRPREEIRRRRATAAARGTLQLVDDIHSDDVLAEVRRRDLDLGLIYGGPILEPALFEIPAFGTLGIHHGKVPEYRGKKTTFWAMHNGEATAGVTIQRVNAGIDTGELVRTGHIQIGRRRYGEVWRDLERLGLDLYLQAVLDVKRGRAVFQPQTGARGRLYRDPGPADLLRYYWRRLSGSRRDLARAPASAGGGR